MTFLTFVLEYLLFKYVLSKINVYITLQILLSYLRCSFYHKFCSKNLKMFVCEKEKIVK